MACREAVQAVVNGADMNACCMGQPAIELIRDTNSLAGGENSEAPTSTANLTALHFACQVYCCYVTTSSVLFPDERLQSLVKWAKWP